ncbi:MAG: hypothetical protein LBI10_01445 [Deltaproteobacteria bacterium]|jgi:hypothetical protein|nr:hypothetical protein [Deltaproteobacteria bacterium]
MALHRAADDLFSKTEEIEDLIQQNLPSKFNYDSTIALYDLTNTYFEVSPDDEGVKIGFSNKKKVRFIIKSLPIMLDWSCFIRKTGIFPENISEPKTLEVTIKALNPPPRTMFIMDRGLATAANVAWLVKNNFRYLVVNNERTRTFDTSLSHPLMTAGATNFSFMPS